MENKMFLIEFVYGHTVFPRFSTNVPAMLVYAESYKKAKQKIIDAKSMGKPKYEDARNFKNLTIK